MTARKRKSTGNGRRSGSKAKAPGGPSKKAARSTGRASKASPVEEPAEASLLEKLPDGKLYYRIGEVAEITEVKPHVLRYWETEFRWMAPPKSRAKQRLYRRKDIEMILAIKRLLYEERYTIAGARRQLRDLGLGRVAEAGEAGLGRKAAGQLPARKTASAEELSAGILASELRATYQRLRGELQEVRDLL